MTRKREVFKYKSKAPGSVKSFLSYTSTTEQYEGNYRNQLENSNWKPNLHSIFVFLRSLWFFLPSSLPIPMANPTVVTRPTMPWVDQIIKITHFNCITKSIYELCSTHPTTNLIGVWMTTIITPTTASTRAVTVTAPRGTWEPTTLVTTTNPPATRRSNTLSTPTPFKFNPMADTAMTTRDTTKSLINNFSI